MSEELFSYLIDQTQNECDDIAIYAIKQLGPYSKPKKIECLIDIIRYGTHPKKTETAILSLSTTKPIKHVINILITQLFREEEEIRSAAAWVLSKYQEAVLTELRAALDKKDITLLDEKAIWLLGQVGGEDELNFLEHLREKALADLNFLFEDVSKSITRRNVNLWFKEKEKIE